MQRFRVTLFIKTWPWPYLILRRLDGRAWRGAPLDAAGRETVAYHLGQTVRTVHSLPPPVGLPGEGDWLPARGKFLFWRNR